MRLPASCPSTALFEEALRGASRALAGKREFELGAGTFAETTPPRHPASAAHDDYVSMRGRCDAQAMKARFQDAALYRRMRPSGPVSGALFERLEAIRIEACASRRLPGAGINLAALFEHECSIRGNNILDTDAPAALPNAVVFAARAGMLNETPPAPASRLLARWKDEIEHRCGALIASLAANATDQRAFARDALALIDNLELHDEPQRGSQAMAAEVPPGAQPPESASGADAGMTDGMDGSGPEQAAIESDEAVVDADESAADQGAGDPGPGAAVVPFPRDGQEGPERVDSDAGDGDPERTAGEARDEKPPAYRAWTTRFDEVVRPQDLLDRRQLETLRRQLELQLAKHRFSAVKLSSRLQNSLRTLQKKSWTFDLDDGLLDTTRLARLVTDPASPLVYKQERDRTSRDTVVSFLVDNSGSMRGRPIALAAMFVDILCQALERCQVATEILGFTTREWRGGRARRRWRDAGKPPGPGRLSDLRHVVYKTADEPWRRARQTLGGMLWPQLLKENIDGEALLWAHSRLAGRPERRRILIVVSDGVPADDSTLSANSGDYLVAHLRQVVGWIENRSPVELVAVGVGHDVGGIYRRSTAIADIEQLGEAIAHQIVELLGNAPAACHPFALSSLAG